MRQKIKKLFFYGSWLFRFSVATIFCLIISLPLRLNKKYKNLWLIEERPDEARDNGYWLYKWILENKPKENVRYVLSRESTDYDKMPRKDLIIKPNSLKHYVLFILSSYSVSTHMHGACPGKSFCIPFLPLMRRKKTVFLQHGVVRNLLNLRGGLDAIIATSEEERDILISANPRYKDKIFITGLCRYDQLKDCSGEQKEKIILVMPTFRRWLRDIGRLKNSDSAFKKTRYYKMWNSFLNDRSLERLVRDNNARVIFFPHKEMQKLAKNFKSKSKQITIGKPGEFDIQTLLKSSSILITDYSSVFFDFIYMQKPVSFYQFDYDDFFSKHYRSDGRPYPFGNIASNEEALLGDVAAIISRGYSMEKRYLVDSKKFFKYRDSRNCERVYNVIKGLR